jgi:predicted phosphodiesterase
MSDVSILHIADLHYVSPNTNFQDDNKADVPAAMRVSAFTNFHAILQHGFAGRDLDAISLGGDITTHGKTEGFQLFEKNTLPLLRELVPSAAICAVAGNHDVVWNLDPNETSYFDVKFKDFSELVQRNSLTSCLIPTGTVPSSPNDPIQFSSSSGVPVYVDPGQRLLMLCVNSSIRCGEVNVAMRSSLRDPILKVSATHPSAKTQLDSLLLEIDRRSLFDIPHVTNLQLNELSTALIKIKSGLGELWPEFTKVAVVHHHVVPFKLQVPEYKPFEIMADAAGLLEVLTSFGFQVVLTGHKHQPYVQQLRFRESELLIVGGLTVGGYPMPGSLQGLRHIHIRRQEQTLTVRVADIPCNQLGDLPTLVSDAINGSQTFTLRPSFFRRNLFPSKIERAVDEQLYNQPFYKSDVQFEVEISNATSGKISFETTMSYGVVNRTSEEKEWRFEYKFDHTSGTVEEIRVNGKALNVQQRDFHTNRGISIPVTVGAGKMMDLYLRIKEVWPDHGSTLYTSYTPATDLRVIVRCDTSDLDLDFEPLYFLDGWDKLHSKRNYYEILFDKGVLPFEGLRLNWAKKGGAIS